MIDQASKLREMIAGQSVFVERIGINRKNGKRAHILAVTSGKGGVGKTTVAVNLAILLAEQGRSVLLVDADLGLANVDVILGLDTPRHIGHLMMPDFDASDVAVTGPAGIKVISGGSGLKELADAGATERRILMDKLTNYSNDFDFVVVDTSPGIGFDTVGFLEWADQRLVVTTTEPTSLRDTYALIKTIDRRLPDAQFELLINVASTAEAAAAVSVLNDMLRRFLGKECNRWHGVVRDPAVPKSVCARQALAVTLPRCPAIVSLRELARSVDSLAINAERSCVQEEDGCAVASRTSGR